MEAPTSHFVHNPAPAASPPEVEVPDSSETGSPRGRVVWTSHVLTPEAEAHLAELERVGIELDWSGLEWEDYVMTDEEYFELYCG